MASAERHGRARYRRGCRCDQCKCAENEYQRARRQRIAERAVSSQPAAAKQLVAIPGLLSRRSHRRAKLAVVRSMTRGPA
jgi:hypothetical protein